MVPKCNQRIRQLRSSRTVTGVELKWVALANSSEVPTRRRSFGLPSRVASDSGRSMPCGLTIVTSQPFCSRVFSNSSHGPENFAEQYRQLALAYLTRWHDSPRLAGF